MSGPMTVTCPACGAAPGQACNPRSARPGTHTARIKFANDARRGARVPNPGKNPQPYPEPLKYAPAAALAYTVVCPECGATTGQVCVYTTGELRGQALPGTAVHFPRVDAANKPKTTGNNVSTALLVQCPDCHAAPMNGCVQAPGLMNAGQPLARDQVHAFRVDAARKYMEEQGWIAPEPVDLTVDGPEYYDRTAMVYLRMARNEDRYTRKERIGFAVKAAELLMMADERSPQ